MADDVLDPDGVPPARVRASDAILIALGETRAAAKQAAETAARVEQSVGSLGMRVGRLEADMAALNARFDAQQDADRDRRESEQSTAVTKTSPWTVVAVIIAGLAVLIPLLVDAYRN